MRAIFAEHDSGPTPAHHLTGSLGKVLKTSSLPGGSEGLQRSMAVAADPYSEPPISEQHQPRYKHVVSFTHSEWCS